MKSKTITLSHGSGGRDSAELMDAVFGRYFSNRILDKMEDGAVLDLESGRIVTSTDSFVVTPLEFNGGDIGKLSVCGTVNDILMMGGEPKYLTCGFIIEEGMQIEKLDRIVQSAANVARNAGVLVAAGDTKVIDRSGDGEPGLFINTTGIGSLPEGRSVTASGVKAGDIVILSGNLGDHHACILSARMNIDNGIKSDCGILSEIPQSLYDAGINIHTMRDVTRGGLGTVLNEIADKSSIKIEINEKDIPVSLEVRNFCGIMGLDPLYMGNEGKMVIMIDGSAASDALKLIRKTEAGKDAVIIGQALDGTGVFSHTGIGGTRKIDLLYGEGLPRIC